MGLIFFFLLPLGVLLSPFALIYETIMAFVGPVAEVFSDWINFFS